MLAGSVQISCGLLPINTVLEKNLKNEGNRLNILDVVFCKLSDDACHFYHIRKPEISRFFTAYSNLIGKSQKTVLAGAHKKFERCQHTEMYLLVLKAQGKIKLPLDMQVCTHFCSSLPDKFVIC